MRDWFTDVDNRNNSKRASWDFYNMIKAGAKLQLSI
jgi:hypothetical protein